MVCPKCQNPIPEGGSFCPQCGYRVPREQAPAEAPMTEAPAPEAPAAQEVPAEAPMTEAPAQKAQKAPAAPAKPVPPRPAPQRPAPAAKKNNMALLLGIVAGAAVLMCIVLTVVLLVVLRGQKKDAEEEPSGKVVMDLTEQYATARELLDRGLYAQAKTAFEDLGDYDDAPDMARYAAAQVLLGQGKYAEARDAFKALNVLDAQELAAQCQNELTYQEAMAKKTAGDYDAAARLFAQIPGVKDADRQAADCEIQLSNAQITAAIDRKDWETALELLDADGGKNYPDYDKVRQDCFNRANYDKAKKAMDNKLYYTAYKMFSAMGNYQDAASLAASCQRPLPDSSELSRNQSYSRKAVQYNMDNRTNGYNMYVRLYDSTGATLVSTAFIHAGKTAVLFLPDTTYLVKVAFGRGAWYGEAEMFGDEGIYKELGTLSLTTTRRYWYSTFDDETCGTTVSREDF